MKKFYIGERQNPQLAKSYYIAYGQLTKKEAKEKERPLYGSVCITAFDDKPSYDARIAELEAEGYTVNRRQK